MKIAKLLILSAVILLSANTSFAQLRVGGGIGYGTDIEELGIMVRGLYDIDDEWRGAASFVYYLDGIEDVSFWEINFNGHYVIVDNGNIQVHALAGLNFTRVGFTFIDFNGNRFSEGATETGINIGGGVIVPLSDALDLIADLKYVISDASQLLLAVGVIVPIGD